MSVSLPELEKQLKVVTRTGKYVVGRREIARSLKGSKLLVWSAYANVPGRILDECRSLEIPSVRFDGNPIELGKTCGIPYKVSVFAVKSQGDAVLDLFSGSRDYGNSSNSSAAVILSQKTDGAKEKRTKSTREKEPKKQRAEKKKEDLESEPKEKKKGKNKPKKASEKEESEEKSDKES